VSHLLLLPPTVDARTEWRSTMQRAVLEARRFILPVCRFAQEKDHPENHAVRNPEGRSDRNSMIRGGTVVVSPLDKVPVIKGVY